MTIWKGAHPRNFRSDRAGFRPEAVVIHIMDGTLSGTDSWFNDARSQVSAHYGIGRSGAVHQYVKEAECAFHAGTVQAPSWRLIKRLGNDSGFINPNFYTIGVEHEGKGLSPDAWPPAMLDASIDLVADIAHRWGIPVDADHIVPHGAIRSSKPNCPGAGVNLPMYIAAVKARQPGAELTPGEHPVALTVRVLGTANIRPRPGTAGLPLRRLARGDTFAAVAVVAGTTVTGNSNWFRNVANEYLWAGITDHPFPG